MTDYPTIVPMLAYEDPAAAIEWLERAFGFRDRGERYTDERGVITHAELELGRGVIMLANPTPEYQSPRHHDDVCEPARRWRASVPYVIDGILAHVDDVDAHFERAKAAGATILTEPEDAGFGRHYRAEDLEGHRWMFAGPLRVAAA